MGQELAVTPLQLIAAFNAIANDGILLRPRIIAEVLDPEGQVVQAQEEPQQARRVISPDVAQLMLRRILRETVIEGSGQAANLDRWQVAGKTGTAQIPYEDRRGYEPGAYLSSFIATAPVSDPRVTVLIMIRKPNPRLGYYGRKVAVPAVGRILEFALNYLDVPPDRPVEPSTQLAAP
jgi:stage V sporulation protein D (sporulation-specific penicillin-binding protein)